MEQQSIDMINNIYQGADMGFQGTELLIKKSEDNEFTKKLHEYVSSYKDIKKQAAEMLERKGKTPQGSGAMEKAGLFFGVQMNTLLDKSSSHMAEMLIEGSTMGIIEGVKQKNSFEDADPECEKLADKFLNLQQTFIDDMKQFVRN